MKVVRDYIIKFLTAMGQMDHPQGKNAEAGVMNMKTSTRHELTSEGWWGIIPYMDHKFKLNALHPYVCRCNNTHLEWTGYRTVCINCFGAQGKTIIEEPMTLDMKEYLIRYPSMRNIYMETLTPNYKPNCTFGDREGMMLGLPNDDGFIPVLVRQYKDIGGTMVVRPNVPYDQVVLVKDDDLTITKLDNNVVDLIYDNNCVVVRYEGNCIVEKFAGTIIESRGKYVRVFVAPDKHVWCSIDSVIFTKFDETVNIVYEDDIKSDIVCTCKNAPYAPLCFVPGHNTAPPM